MPKRSLSQKKSPNNPKALTDNRKAMLFDVITEGMRAVGSVRRKRGGPRKFTGETAQGGWKRVG